MKSKSTNTWTEYSIRVASDSDRSAVADFCTKLPYSPNNSSLDAMKWDWCMEHGQWTVIEYKDTIISVGGIHAFDHKLVPNNSYRCMFRGATLPGHTLNTLSFPHNSLQVNMMIPFQRSLYPNSDVFITTNIESDHRDYRLMNDMFLPKLAAKGLVRLTHTHAIVNGCLQNIWQV